MSFQYTYDAKGKPVGVFVSINKWDKITDELKKNKSGKGKNKILKSVEKEIKQIEKGRLKSIPLKQLPEAL